jgi:hypothetical protein
MTIVAIVSHEISLLHVQEVLDLILGPFWTRQVLAEEAHLYLMACLVTDSSSTNVYVFMQIELQLVHQLIKYIDFLGSQVLN